MTLTARVGASAVWLHLLGTCRHDGGVQVNATSNDPVRLAFLTALPADAGIRAILLDQHMSAVEGSIGAIPRRLMVAEEDYAQARRVLTEAGEAWGEPA